MQMETKIYGWNIAFFPLELLSVILMSEHVVNQAKIAQNKSVWFLRTWAIIRDIATSNVS